MQKNNTHHQTSNLWFGFAIGISAGTALTFLFGTSQGRKWITHLLHTSENLGETLKDVMRDFEKEASQNSHATFKNTAPEEKKHQNTLESVINKIRSVSSSTNQFKHFFIKD